MSSTEEQTGPILPSQRAVERIVIYRRALEKLAFLGVETISSEQLALRAACTASVVRRDMEHIEYQGKPGRGYEVERLLRSLVKFLDAPRPQGVAVVGAGALGAAIVGYMANERMPLAIGALFDKDPIKVGTEIRGYRCLPLQDLVKVVTEENITIGIITVPPASAQEVATLLVRAGVKGILNFAPIILNVPDEVQVENVDIIVGMEKLAYFVRVRAESQGTVAPAGE